MAERSAKRRRRESSTTSTPSVHTSAQVRVHAKRRRTSVAQHKHFEFHRLPAVARYRILSQLVGSRTAVCVCWLWSRLCATECHDDIKRLMQRGRRLSALSTRAIRQTEVTRDMWPVLVDWLVDVAEEFELKAETLHGAVVYLRVFTAKNLVRRSEFQLLGATCLFVAAKFFEKDDMVPSLHDLVYMADKAFTQYMVVNAEVQVVHALSFELHVTTPLSLLLFYFRTLNLTPRNEPHVCFLAMSLLELSLLRNTTLKLKPSVSAAASLYIAISMRLGSLSAADFWDGSIYLLTGLTPTKAPLSNAIGFFYQLRANPPAVSGQSLLAVHNKYAVSAYSSVSLLQLDQ